MCAIMRGTGYAAIGGTITDYVDTIACTVLLSSFSPWHTQKKDAPQVRIIKRVRIGVVPGGAGLGVNSSPIFYTWPVFHDISEAKQYKWASKQYTKHDTKGTPTTILGK